MLKMAALWLGLFACGLARSAEVLPLTGHVVDSKAMLVAGAEVAGYEWVDGYGDGAMFGDMRASARSDDHGRFTMTIPQTPRCQFLVVAAWKPGLAVGWEMIEKGRVSPDIVIPLTRPSSLAGAVTDEHKHGVVGATLRVCLKHERMRLRGLPGIDFHAPLDWFTTQTDSNGRFRFDRIPQGATADLWVEAKGRASIWTYWKGGAEGGRFAAGATDIQISVGPESRIEGHVVDEVSGRPVPGIRLMVRPDARWAGIWRADTVVAGEDGQFSFSGLTAGPWSITVALPDDTRDERVATGTRADVGPGEVLRGVDVKMGKGAILEVAVADSVTKKPVEGVRVWVSQATASGGYGCYEKSVRCNKEGLASFRVPPSRCTITAGGEGYSYADCREPVEAMGGNTYRRVMELDGTARLRGTVRDPAGNGAADTLVVSRISNSLQRTGPTGEYELPWDNLADDPAAKIPLLAQDAPHCRAAMVEITPNTTSMDLTLRPAYRLVGKVTDPCGQGIPLASIWLSGETRSSGIPAGHAVLTDSQGKFAIPAVPAPIEGIRYTMEVQADGFGPGTVREVSGFGDTGHPVAVPSIVLQPADQSVSGVVQDANGRPLPNVPVYSGGPGQPRREAVTGADGGFRIVRVCRGPIWLGANYSNSPEGSGSAEADVPAEGVRIVFGKRLVHTPETSILGRPLPDLAGLCVDLAQNPLAGKRVLVCLVDLEQRPSRRLLSDLAAKTDILAAKHTMVLVVQVSKVDLARYEAWLKENKIAWPIHVVEGDVGAKKAAWGVKALPWLILTDKGHVVRAEGLSAADLEQAVGKAR